MELSIEKKLGILIVSIVLLGTLEVFGKEDTSVIVPYDNKVLEISHQISSGNKHVVHMVFLKEPICYLVPMSYESMYDAALSKSYFLPRAIFTDHQMKYFYKDLRAFLEQAGILVQFEEIRNKNYGIMIHFKIAQSDKVYLLEKLIDANNKTLDFVITEKM
jgi:hypothetical protein